MSSPSSEPQSEPQITQSETPQVQITQSQSQSQSQSEPQTPPSPPTAIPTPNPPPPIIQALSYSPFKKPLPIPWSHEETLNLIRAYQEKWYSLKRGQLKASQWEEVAITVAARCGLDEPSKSGTQCRHKIEKLRKRYRSEKSKLPPSFNYHNHPWIYFALMDQLERGPLPISAVAPQAPPQLKNDDVDDTDDDEGDLRFASLRNLRGADNNNNNNNGLNSRDFDKGGDGFFRIGRNSGDFGNGYVRGSETVSGNLKRKQKRWSYREEENEDEDEGGYEMEDDEGQEEMADEKGTNCNLVGELAAQIRDFAEKFVRVEKKKLELMRETERFRNEMENKRMEMIYVSQQKTVELINKAFDVASSSQKKMKMNPDL